MSIETYHSKASSLNARNPSIPRMHSAHLPKLKMSPMLICGVCGRSGKYDVGGVVVSPSRYFERLEAEKAAAAKANGASGDASSPIAPLEPARRSRRKARLDSAPTLFRLGDSPGQDLDAPAGRGGQEGIPAEEVRGRILAPATLAHEKESAQQEGVAPPAKGGSRPGAGARVDTEPTALEYAIGFTRYFRCKHCDAGGPWRLPHATAIRINLLLSFNRITGEKNGVCFAEGLLYDGTWSPYPTWGERELRGRLEHSPRDASLWLRLGNLLKNADRADLSRAPYATALRLDPLLLDAHLGLADAHGCCRAPRKAYAQWKEMLRAAAQAVHLPREQRLEAVSVALDRALDLAPDANDVFELLPQPAPDAAAPRPAGTPDVLHVTELDLSNPRDWRKICAAFLGEPLLSPEELRRRERSAGLDANVSPWTTNPLPAGTEIPPARRVPRPMREAFAPGSFAADLPSTSTRATAAVTPHVGRNAACPCGSGRKYKRCCGAIG